MSGEATFNLNQHVSLESPLPSPSSTQHPGTSHNKGPGSSYSAVKTHFVRKHILTDTSSAGRKEEDGWMGSGGAAQRGASRAEPFRPGLPLWCQRRQSWYYISFLEPCRGIRGWMWEGRRAPIRLRDGLRQCAFHLKEKKKKKEVQREEQTVSNLTGRFPVINLDRLTWQRGTKNSAGRSEKKYSAESVQQELVSASWSCQ